LVTFDAVKTHRSSYSSLWIEMNFRLRAGMSMRTLAPLGRRIVPSSSITAMFPRS
jgi:hypothetical protein